MHRSAREFVASELAEGKAAKTVVSQETKCRHASSRLRHGRSQVNSKQSRLVAQVASGGPVAPPGGVEISEKNAPHLSTQSVGPAE